MNAEELKEILSLHRRWEIGSKDGVKANFEGKSLMDCDLSGAELREVSFVGANLIRTNFRGANLQGANFAIANMDRANFRDANLTNAQMIETNLVEADFENAIMHKMDMKNSIMRGANLRNAYLMGANMNSCYLGDADFTGANLIAVSMTNINLSGAKGLISPAQWMEQFERDDLGWIVFKSIGDTEYPHSPRWQIFPGSFLTEVANPNRADDCGCGVNFGTREWCSFIYQSSTLWRCRIRYEDGPGIVVPYATGGKARCERLELIREEENS